MTLRIASVAAAVLTSMAFSACGSQDRTTTVVLKSPAASTADTTVAAGAARALADDQARSQDADAKSSARNAVTQMESCLTDDDYAVCARSPDVTSLASTSGVDGFNYLVTATSKSGNTFTIAKTDGEYERTCTGSSGGCQGGSW